MKWFGLAQTAPLQSVKYLSNIFGLIFKRVRLFWRVFWYSLHNIGGFRI